MENDLRKSIKLLLINKHFKFAVNNKFNCKIENTKAFDIFTRDKNCPRYVSFAMVKVEGYCNLAKLDISWSVDLENDLNSTLTFYDDNGNISTLMTVTNLKFI